MIDPTTTVTDVQGPLNEMLTDSAVFNIPDSHTCSTNPLDYIDGAYQHPEVNTATLSTGGSDTASTVVNCYAPVVSKTAAGAYDERHDWTITKSVDLSTQNAFAGDTVSYEWTVAVGETVTEEKFVASGTISVTNPRPDDGNMVVGLSDALSDGLQSPSPVARAVPGMLNQTVAVAPTQQPSAATPPAWLTSTMPMRRQITPSQPRSTA